MPAPPATAAPRSAGESGALRLLLVLLAVLYVAGAIGLRGAGFMHNSDTVRVLYRAVPDLVRGEFQSYSLGAGGAHRTPVAPGVGVRNGYPPGPTLLHVPAYVAVQRHVLSHEEGLVWAALPFIIGEVLCAWAIVRFAAEATGGALLPWPTVLAAAFLRSAVVWEDALNRGHWEGLMAFCLLQAVRHYSARPAWAGVWAGAALLLKTTALVAVVPLAFVLVADAAPARRVRAAAAFAGAVAVVFVPPLVPYLLADPAGVEATLVHFPGAITFHPGSLWALAFKALGADPLGPVGLRLRFLTTPLLFLVIGAVSLVVVARGRPERRRQDTLGLMALGAVGLVALGKIPNPWYAVMGVAFVLAWAGSIGTMGAYAWAVAFVLALDTAVGVLHAQLSAAALTLIHCVALAAIAAVLLAPEPAPAPEPASAAAEL